MAQLKKNSGCTSELVKINMLLNLLIFLYTKMYTNLEKYVPISQEYQFQSFFNSKKYSDWRDKSRDKKYIGDAREQFS